MHKTHIQRAHGPRAPSWDQETGAKMALIGKNLESARIIKKCSNEMICATKWNFRSCFEKVYRSYWSPFISVAKEGAGKHFFWRFLFQSINSDSRNAGLMLDHVFLRFPG